MYHSRRDFLKSMTCTVPAFFIFPGMLRDDQVQASSNYPFIPVDAPNTPMGQGRGIFPGRVIWTYDPNAAVWDCQFGTRWWNNTATNLAVVEDMLSKTLRSLTGTETLTEAWEAIFQYFHQTTSRGYQNGERIAIKINCNPAFDSYPIWNENYTSPQVITALVRQLVENAGVPQDAITVYDAIRHIPDSIVNMCQSVFPEVRFVDWGAKEVRIRSIRDLDSKITWSSAFSMSEIGASFETFLPQCVVEANYLINIADLKGHSIAGITACGKNHYGSILADVLSSDNPCFAPTGAGLHPDTCVHPVGIWPGRPMDVYSPIVDLMGHHHLGGKTLLYLIDGLYAVKDQNSWIGESQRWQSMPFNNGWTSSIFASLDGVSIDSVALDFLRTEPTLKNVYGTVDNYLHDAALADNPPSGVRYQVNDGDRTMESLGVHEHWNNPVDRQYNRNLGCSEGIELIKLTPDTSTGVDSIERPSSFVTVSAFPNPFNPSTTISFRISQKTRVNLTVYNINGQSVNTLVDTIKEAGNHSVIWYGTDSSGMKVASGIYLYRLKAGNFSKTQKMTFMR